MTPQASCSTDEHLVVIGNGMASHRLLEALIKRPGRPSRITVIGAEPVPAYNRILLSSLLAGEVEHAALILRDSAWYAEQGISLRLGEVVTAINPRSRQVVTSKAALSYDRLVLATGSSPTQPDIAGIALDGVHTFRDLDDVRTLQAISRQGGHAVVIGGGLLGLEAAEGLRQCANGRLHISVLQRSARLMNRQLDTAASRLLAETLNQRGLQIITEAQLKAIDSDQHGAVAGVMLADGRYVPASHVIIAAGITPNAQLGRNAGLRCAQGVLVNEQLATSDPRIFALGECCQFGPHTYGLVEPIWRQVEVLAAGLSGDTASGYQEVPSPTKLKVSGIALYAFGPTQADERHEVLRYMDAENGDYKRVLLRNGRIEGAVLYGDTHLGPWYFEQSLRQRDITPWRQSLLFGPPDAFDVSLDTPSPVTEVAYA